MAAYIFDAEFSKKKRGEIVEAAWIRFTDATDLAGCAAIPPNLITGPSFCQRYKPAEPMEFGSIAVHHILPHELDGFLWFCPKCANKLHEEYLHVSDIVKDLPPVFERFYANHAARTCKRCGHVMPPR